MAWALASLALGQLGGDCGAGDGGGGRPAVVSVESPDSRCVALPDPTGFPPGFDFVPGREGRLLAAIFSPPTLIPLDVTRVPFQVPPGTNAFQLPKDADGDGVQEFGRAIDDVFVVSEGLALVTQTISDAVLFIDPDGGAVTVDVSVAAKFAPTDFPGLPAPGQSALRTGLANSTCLVPPAGAVDSRGALLSEVLDPLGWCRPGQPSFRARFTSGAALAAGHLFVSVSNLGDDLGSEDTQYRPAAVTIYDFDTAADPPRASPAAAADGRPYIFASAGGFNATHVDAYISASGRAFVLVTLSGAIGIRADDPNTSVLEGGSVRLSDGAIDVIDAERLRLVATIPLRDANPAFRGLAIDPSGRVGMLGDVTARQLYAVDLSALDALPLPPDPQADEVWVLDGGGGRPNAVIFDGRDPFRIPALQGGSPGVTCPGWIESVAFASDGAHAFALEFCDGSLATLAVLLDVAPPGPSNFRLESVEALTAALRPDSNGQLRQPASLTTRPGRPGVDFVGPDLFFTVGDPEGLLCGIEVASPAP